MIYAVPISQTTVPPDEPGERIVAYLIRAGHPAAEAWIDACLDVAEPCVYVDANADPSAKLTSYVSQPTKEELAWTALRDVSRAIRTNPDPRTAGERLADAERAILALAVLLRLETD